MEKLQQAKNWLNDADAIIVTAGNGFAREEGLDILSEEEFDNNFGKIAEKYNVHTIGDALDKKFDSWDQQWQFWSQLINDYTLEYEPSDAMLALKKLLEDKEYFIATSTFTHFFEKAGFDENRIFNAFGNWTEMHCSSGINHGKFSDLEVVKKYLAGQGEVPKCKICNSEMELHMPLNAHFYPDTDANSRLRWFLTGNEDKKVVILELGVDETSPQLLDPMVKLVEQFDSWTYLAADLTASELPSNLQKRSLAFGSNSHDVLTKLVK